MVSMSGSKPGAASSLVIRACQIGGADGFRRIVGDLDGAERRGDRDGGDRHDGGQPELFADPWPHAGHPAAGSFRSLARLQKCRSGNGGGVVDAGSETIGLLKVYPVSTAVNRVANDTPALIEQVEAAARNSTRAIVSRRKQNRKRAKKDDGQASLF